MDSYNEKVWLACLLYEGDDHKLMTGTKHFNPRSAELPVESNRHQRCVDSREELDILNVKTTSEVQRQSQVIPFSLVVSVLFGIHTHHNIAPLDGGKLHRSQFL